MIKFERAVKDDSEILTQLAIDSEATWGFDAEFMEIFTRTYDISQSFIAGNLVFKMLMDDRLFGFFGVVKEDYISILEYFYIASDFIGKGYGKIMWQYMQEICLKNHITQIEFVTSPEARAFYLSCGAEHIDTVESLVIKGRMIPKFRYIIKQL